MSILTIKDINFYMATELPPKCISDGDLQELAKLVGSMILTALTGHESPTTPDVGSITAIAMLFCLMMLKLTKSYRLEKYSNLLTGIQSKFLKKEGSSHGSQRRPAFVAGAV